MHLMIRHLLSRPAVRGALVAATCAAAAIATAAGCSKAPPLPHVKVAYPDLGLKKNLPPYLHDSILERTDLSNTGPLAVTSYGLVVNLRYSGDTRAPNPVREWMMKE